MKIIQVLGSLTYGGAETMVMNYYRMIDHKKYKIDFIVHAEGNTNYEEEIKKNGDNVFYIPTPGSIGAVKYIRALKDTLLLNGPYDVIHAHTNIQEWMVLFAAYSARIPIRISHSHNTAFNASRIKVIVNRMIVNQFATLRLSCGIKAGKAFYGGRAKFFVLSNAIDVNAFCNAAKNLDRRNMPHLQLSEDDIIIGHVGRFVKQKNHVFLINVFEKAYKDNKHLKLILFGDGPLLEEEKRICEERKISDRVIFAGTTSNMPEAYALFDIFVLPSLHEGLPLTLIEAQCSGLRIYASDSITEECDLRLNKIKYLPLDEATWVKALVNARRKEKEDFTIIKNAARDYDNEIQTARLLTFYEGRTVDE